MTAAALAVSELEVRIERDGSAVTPVRGVSFQAAPGQRLGIIGESGSGKTLTALAVMRLLPPGAVVARGRIELAGEDLVRLAERDMRRVRGRRVAMVYQDPMSALNPLLSVGSQLTESIRAHFAVGRREAGERSLDLLEEVGISEPGKRMQSFPHEFSGGMRQRVVIAMAMACNPEVLIADEPTSALDVTTQVRVIDRLARMTADHATTVLLITHDIAVASGFCDEIQVMYAGRIVERAASGRLLDRPLHPYTEALMNSICTLDSAVDKPLPAISGQPPSPSEMPKGCAFHPRCPYAIEVCREVEPALVEVRHLDRRAACHLAESRAVALS